MGVQIVQTLLELMRGLNEVRHVQHSTSRLQWETPSSSLKVNPIMYKSFIKYVIVYLTYTRIGRLGTFVFSLVVITDFKEPFKPLS